MAAKSKKQKSAKQGKKQTKDKKGKQQKKQGKGKKDKRKQPIEIVDEVVPDDEFYGQVSAEKADTLEADLLLTYAETEKDVETYTSDRLLGRIPALKAGNVYAEIDKHIGLAVTNPTPLSVPFIIENYLPQVAEAVPGE